MIAKLGILGVLGVALVGAAVAPAGVLDLGGALPMGAVEMRNVDGRMLSVNAIAGKQGTLVIFSCNHCPFVKAWEQRMVAIGNGCLTNGIGVMFINANNPVEVPADDLEHMQKQAEAGGYRFPYVVDASSDLARAFGATRTPEAFLFDAAGKLVYHGAIDDNTHEPDKVQKHYLQDAVKALATGKEITVKETSSVGCSIKLRAKAEPAK